MGAKYFIDYEYYQEKGEKPIPTCMVMINAATNEAIKYQFSDFNSESGPLWGPDDVMISYFAFAELSCIEALGWEQPPLVIDMYAEYKHITNGELLSNLVYDLKQLSDQDDPQLYCHL